LRAAGCQHPKHLTDTEDAHHALQIVRQHMKAHLGAYTRKRLGEKVRGAHPELDRAKGMFHRAPSHPHDIWLPIEPLLHGIENIRMFPALDTPVFAGRALAPDRAAWAR
jgi:hypothetical protein